MKFMIYQDMRGLYRWRLYPLEGPPLAEGTAAYPTKTACMAAVEAVKACGSASVEEMPDSGSPAPG